MLFALVLGGGVKTHSLILIMVITLLYKYEFNTINMQFLSYHNSIIDTYQRVYKGRALYAIYDSITVIVLKL